MEIFDGGGWVKLWRKITDSVLWGMTPETLKIAIFLVCEANWKPSTAWNGKSEFTVERGQLITSLDRIALKCGVSKMQVRTALINLEKVNFITRSITHRFSLVTICKYETYQQDDNDKQHTEQHSGNTVVTQQQHSGNTPVTPSKEVKEFKKGSIKEENTPYPQGDMMVLPEIKKSKTNDIPPISKTPRMDTSPFPLPEWIQPCDWIDYVEMRIAIKKPMTRRAMELAVIKLSELAKAGHMPKDVLRQSILNNWQGLFPIKTMTGPSGSVYQKSVPASLQVSPNKYDNLANEVVATMRDKIKDIQ